jgi:hypothetical protein
MMSNSNGMILVSFVMLSWAMTPVRAEEDSWADFRFIMGSWVNDGNPEQGTGECTLKPDLQGKILVRRNQASLPAVNGRPAGTHEDLMVIYRTADGKHVKASYYDNEGHAIRYTVSALSDQKRIVFLSDAEPGAPKFRLTYTKVSDDNVSVKFEIGAPGEGSEFKTYVEGTVRRAATEAKPK